MKNNILKVLVCICSIYLLLASCSKETGTPKSLQEILKRNEVDGSDIAGSGNGGSTGSGQSYQGVYASTVKLLLSRVSGWRTPSCSSCNDGIAPVVNINNNCIRDTYVKAAVGFAWAAESYARLGNNTQATTFANQMNQSLQMARALCSNAPAVLPGRSCLTFTIYPC